MDQHVIFQKTEKGQREIATRLFKLPARVRSMLILVDGKRTAQQVVEQACHFGDAVDFFRHLRDEGFIEPIAGTAAGQAAIVSGPPSVANIPSASPVPDVADRAGGAISGSVLGPSAVPPLPTLPPLLSSANSPRVVREVKAAATRFLTDALGPDADSLTVEIEETTNLAELSRRLERYGKVLRQVRGAALAEKFRQQMQALITGAS